MPDWSQSPGAHWLVEIFCISRQRLGEVAVSFKCPSFSEDYKAYKKKIGKHGQVKGTKLISRNSPQRNTCTGFTRPRLWNNCLKYEFEKTTSEHFWNLRKRHKHTQIQAGQQLPSRINSETHNETHSQTVKRQSQRKNPESRKRKATHQKQEIPIKWSKSRQNFA